ncbi:hypothetical protein MMC34_007131 [Xylographa carneopallida]|nr:hypothetical protein [Xylographa carneopallida]
MANTSPNTVSWRHELGSNDFPIEPDRYYLYVGLFCPFAHRVIITRQLKGLQKFLPMSIIKPYPKEGGGWRFPMTDSEYEDSTVDHLFHSAFLHDVYFKSPPAYSKYEGKYSVPVLWDKKTNQIVNNESEDIMRQLNTAFNDLLPSDSDERHLDFYPELLHQQIDSVNRWLLPDFCGGVYRAGFAPDQESYNKACKVVFASLDRLEELLRSHNGPFILDKQMTELDIKAYATLIRLDTIYVQHFKVNIGTIRHNYPIVHRYLKNIYWNVTGVKETTNFRHIKENYSKSHSDINPKAITPLGPVPDIEPWTEIDEAWRRSCK